MLGSVGDFFARFLAPSCVALIVASTGVSPVGAQPAPEGGAKPQAGGNAPKDAAAAKRMFDGALKQYNKKDYETALALFREALEASDSPNARLYVARCLAELGKPDEAYTEMQRTIADADALAKGDPRYSRTSKSAKDELGRLGDKVALIVVSVVGPTADAATVTVNGAKVEPVRAKGPIAAKPGAISIDVAADGFAPFHRELNVPAGTSENVEAKLEKSAQQEQAAGGSSDGAAASSGGGSSGTVRKVGYAVAAVGIAGGFMFIVTGFAAKGRFDRVDEECGGKRCTDPKYADDISTGKMFTTLANVGLVVGIAGLAGGAAMIALGGPKESASAAPASGRFVAVGPTVGGVVARGRF